MGEGCSHDTYEGGVHVGCRIRCAHDCCPIHHKPVWGAPVFQEHNWDQITLGFSRVHPGGRWGRPGCQCTPPLHHRPLQELARRDWKRIFLKRNGEKEVEGSPWLNPWHLSIVVSIHQDHPSLTLARNQRRLHGEEKRNLQLINDHLHVYRCDHAQGHRSSRGGSLCGENQMFFLSNIKSFWEIRNPLAPLWRLSVERISWGCESWNCFNARWERSIYRFLQVAQSLV